ncbi:MAG: glycosyltransferase [Rikenellaceae bacterium]
MESKRIKILISAYACEPNLGSEIGVGWHWVLEMSKYFDLWVLTRESNRDSIEGWFAENPSENRPTFIYYDLPKKWRFWKKGLRGVRTYYMLWQHLTNKIVRRTMQQNDIKIYHLLTYGNALWPASSYGAKQTFIWGPIGVCEVVPKEYSKHFGLKSRLKEIFQRTLKKSLLFNAGFVSRCKNANLILCKTAKGIECIPSRYRDKAILFTDVAVEYSNVKHDNTMLNTPKNIINYLAVGSLEGWRGFDVLLEAFSIAVSNNRDLHLSILGRGSEMDKLKLLVKHLNLEDNVVFHGQVSRGDYQQHMNNCDVVINPCLREGAVTTSFDSMAFSKPLICIDSKGHTNYFDSTYAMKIELGTRQNTINLISEAILQMQDHELRSKMGRLANESGLKYNWEAKGVEISILFNDLHDR